MDLEKVKEKVKEVIQKATNNYFEKKYRIAYVILSWEYDTGCHGAFMLEMWPGTHDVELCFSPEAAGYADLGTTIGSVSMEYFNIDTIAHLIKTMYDSYVA